MDTLFLPLPPSHGNQTAWHSGTPPVPSNLITEASDNLVTEAGDQLTTES